MTSSIDILKALKEKFANAITSINETAVDPFAVVSTEHLLTICHALKNDYQFDILNDLCGVDYFEPDAKKLAKAGFEPHFEVVYHLQSFNRPNQRLTIKVILPRPAGKDLCVEVPTVSSIWRTADWHEREAYDLLGIKFTDHPDLRRILLSDDWVGYPMRKDYEFPLEYNDIRCR